MRGHADERKLVGGRRGDAEVDGEFPAPGPLPLHEGKALKFGRPRRKLQITHCSTGCKVGI